MTEPQADPFITLASAYLHDTIDDKVVQDEQVAKQELKHFLIAIDLKKKRLMQFSSSLKICLFQKGYLNRRQCYH